MNPIRKMPDPRHRPPARKRKKEDDIRCQLTPEEAARIRDGSITPQELQAVIQRSMSPEEFAQLERDAHGHRSQ